MTQNAKLRRWLATRLVILAQRIDPQSEAVMNFWVGRMTDFIIEGKSTIKITVEPDEPMR